MSKIHNHSPETLYLIHKNFAFLEKETKDLDKGEVDLESAQSCGEEDTEETAE